MGGDDDGDEAAESLSVPDSWDIKERTILWCVPKQARPSARGKSRDAEAEAAGWTVNWVVKDRKQTP